MALGLGIIGGLIQKAPGVPKLEKIDPLANLKQAISANQAALPAATELASDTTAAQQGILLDALRRGIPRFDEIFAKGGEAISDFLSGIIPADVASQVTRRAGSKAFAGGFGYAPARGNLEARDLGLTSLDLIKTGIDTGTRWLQGAAALTTPGVFNISSMFLNPMQLYAMQNEQNLQQFQRSFAKEQIDAPYKWQNILGNALINAEAFVQQIGGGILSSYAGGMVGGGGGMGGGMSSGGGGGGSQYPVYNPSTPPAWSRGYA